jgi:hypothetical protein
MARTKRKAESNPEPQPLRLEWRSPAELAENPRNWRRHPEAQQAALAGVLAEVGWAGACLYNERTGRLIDGHLRRKVALDQGAASVPVLVGSWDEASEAKILATLDPLAGMAVPDAAALHLLIQDVQTDCPELRGMIDQMWTDVVDVAVFDAAETSAPELPSGDREPFQQMTFTLHDSQAEIVKAAIEKAKAAGPFDGSPNENSNGNALARIAEAYRGPG